MQLQSTFPYLRIELTLQMQYRVWSTGFIYHYQIGLVWGWVLGSTTGFRIGTGIGTGTGMACRRHTI